MAYSEPCLRNIKPGNSVRSNHPLCNSESLYPKLSQISGKPVSINLLKAKATVDVLVVLMWIWSQVLDSKCVSPNLDPILFPCVHFFFFSFLPFFFFFRFFLSRGVGERES